MAKLSENRKAFLQMMREDEDYERRGFELILARPDFAEFFDALAEAGLFEPSRNSGPVPADKPGYYRIPPWHPLGYLEAVAKLAGETRDAALAEKVLVVIRNVSKWRDGDGKPRDNRFTWFTFAKILGLLPMDTITMADIDLVPTWLGGQFDRSTVGHALAGEVLRRFIGSDRVEDWRKACRILYHCTAIEWIDDKWFDGSPRKTARTVVEDYWLKQIVAAAAVPLGKKLGKETADLFQARLKELFPPGAELSSSASRPAIEDNEQNHDWDGPTNRFVEGLRDSLIAWVDADPATAQPYIDQLLQSGSEAVERVAIHAVIERFPALRPSVPHVIKAPLFDSRHLHEMHRFLKTHFKALMDEEKAAVLAVVRGLPLPQRADESERLLRRVQRNWLLPIAGQGYPPADDWLGELNADENLGPPSPHPDFVSYHTSRSGSGPTPHSAQDLAAFAEAGVIVDKLNAFTPSQSWDGPTVRSLADSVTEAVTVRPGAFLAQLPSFLKAKPEYQYAIIAGFKRLWDAWDGKKPDPNWADVWPKLIDLFEGILTDEKFWAIEVVDDHSLSPNRDWVPPVIAEFLRAGTMKDDKAYDPALLPRGWALINILLQRCAPEKEPAVDDVLNRAINTPKGKAVEALLDHALRVCRISDRESKSHAAAWAQMQPAFDREIAACRDGNFEFSALAGAYIANLQYLDGAWLHANFTRIFPIAHPANCLSALDGLAYAPSTEPVYRELVDTGVLLWALKDNAKPGRARENLLQRMSLSYLSGKEGLDSPAFAYLFDAKRTDDLDTVSNYFWAVRGDNLTADHKEKIFGFWDKCVAWSRTQDPPPAALLSALSLLTCHLDAVGTRELPWLLAVAPHVSVDYNADRFAEELERLADASPKSIGEVLVAMLNAYEPIFDFEDRLKNLVTKLAANRDTRPDAIKALDRLSRLPGFVQLYKAVMTEA